VTTDPPLGPADSVAGRYAFPGLERTMHEKARLGILASLIARPEGLLFAELRDLCALTDGNLNRHLKVLEEAGLVEIWKGFRLNRPQTLIRMTGIGRQRFTEYLAELERVVTDAMRRAQEIPTPSSADISGLTISTRLGLTSG
jgi:DNA-binding MarR family transcriptional regulator